jgi:hypothetical protein
MAGRAPNVTRECRLRRSLLASIAVLLVATLAALLVVLVPGTGEPKRTPRFVDAVAGTVDLGSRYYSGAPGAYGAYIASQAPDDDVYFVGGASGARVFVVRGLAAPTPFLTASAPVLALLATSTDLYLVAAVSISEYALPSGRQLGNWSLPKGLLPFGNLPNQAGLVLEGKYLWVWVALELDIGGWEPGSLVLFNTSTRAAKVINRLGLDPGYVTSGPEGFYYGTPNGRVVLCRPNGSLVVSTFTDVGLLNPMAAIDGNIYLDTGSQNGRADTIHVLDASTLRAARTVQLSAPIGSLLTTPCGLAALSFDRGPSGKETIVFLDLASGQERGPLVMPAGTALLLGSHLSAFVQRGSQLELIRLRCH